LVDLDPDFVKEQDAPRRVQTRAKLLDYSARQQRIKAKEYACMPSN
jgi:hypothetical protein